MPPIVALTRPLDHAHRLVLAAALVIAATIMLLPSGAVAAPGDPTPTVASVTARLDALANQTEALTEQFNSAQTDVERQQKAVVAAQRNAEAAASRFEAARRQLAQISLAQYEGGSFSHTGAILTSATGQNYLDTLATQDLIAAHSAGVMARVDTAHTEADTARKRTQTLLAAARTTRDLLKTKREKVISETAKYQTMLASLTAAQRQAYTTRNAPTPAQVQTAYRVHAGNVAAQKAVDFAVAQVGKPYVWAASGPDSFDCSGLTMAAWAKGGVSLPHFAASQYTYGTHVSYDSLQPGDLVFLYSDLHHVEIYIGNGLAVSAPQPGENVKIVRVADSRSDFVGATRLI